MAEKQTVEVPITKALSRVGTIQARLNARTQNVLAYACRSEKHTDPIKEEGGSPAYVRKNLDALRDLENNLVTIRSAVQRANFDNRLTVCGQTRTVQQWLNWRQEVLPHRKAFLETLLTRVESERRQLGLRGQKEAEDLHVNFPEEKMREELTTLIDIENTLDEELSVYDATVMVKIPA